MRTPKFVLTGLLLIFVLVFAACAPAADPVTEEPVAEEPVATEEVVEEETDDAPMPQSIAEIASGSEDFSTLVAALDAAGLVDTFASEGEYTVFAPTNAAFAAALADLGLTAEELLSDTDTLTQILQYHVVPGVVTADEIVNIDQAETLLGETVDIRVEDGQVYVNDAMVTTADIMASNGVIHVIDSVLLPSGIGAEEADMDDGAAEEEMMSIAELASGSEDLSTLVAALGAAGLVDTFAGEGEYTVFAPTNAAFETALADLGLTADELFANTELLTSVLTYHVVEGALPAEEVLSQNLLFTLNGAPALAYATDEGAFIQNAQIVQTDITASNGIVHIIDAVILPPTWETEADNDIVTVAVENGSFTILAQALETAGLVEVLQGDGPWTVFAPTDAAFEAALTELGITAEELLADEEMLRDILLYHVTVGALDSGAVLANGSIPMVNGDLAEIDADALTIAGTAINADMIDIEASNGIIHVLDGVMLPPAD